MAWWLVGCAQGTALPHGARAGDCGTCHREAHDGWSRSAHAQSAASPVFVALLPKVEAAWGATARARCVSCHAPGFGGDSSIGCVSCHAAIGNRGEANGALVVDLDAPLSSTSRGVSLPSHEVAPRRLLTAPSLCGTCHEVHGPGVLEEPTLTEFRASPFAGTKTCSDCHAVGHRLVGVDPRWDSEAEAAVDAEATRALWAKGLTLSVTETADGVVVRLQNTGAGHAVPTGVTVLRDVWVDVEVVDAQGMTTTLPRVMELGAAPLRDGAEVALFTDATSVKSRSLMPGEVREWSSPRSAGWRSFTATLKATAVRLSVLRALGLDGLEREVPVHEVSRVEWPLERP